MLESLRCEPYGIISCTASYINGATGIYLPTFDNFHRMVPPGINYDPRLALRSMKRIISSADVVIPGHDDVIYL